MNYLKGENFTENSKRNVKSQWEFRKFIKKNVNGIESKYPFTGGGFIIPMSS